MVSCEQAIVSTKAWIDAVVVGLNFCPFAKKEVINNRIRYCCQGDKLSHKKLLKVLQQEVTHLQNNEETETTLVILITGYESFFDYLDVLDKAEGWIDDNDLRGEFQLASFHPDYCFDGEPDNAAANYTNRSPYPMLHILRESSMEIAISAYKKPEQIPINNIEKAKELGVKGMQKLLKKSLKAS